MRVYVPVPHEGLRRLQRTGELGPPPLPAYAVTTDLRTALPGAGDEELEYVASAAAAEAALRDDGALRVVVAADASDSATQPDPGADHPAAVVLAATLPLSRVAALLVDDPATGPAAEHELGWYAVQELDAVVELLG